jgi:DNA (cytosine-5)-methyltransferase 1
MIIKVGTDCSGIEAPIQALKKISLKTGLKFVHVFSSEIDQYAQETLHLNYRPKIFYNDMTKRDYSKIPKIDIYVCGFPCQPFSLCGNRLGQKDRRANIFEYCIKTIKQTEPSIFILENVKTIATLQNGSYLMKIKNILNKLEKYHVEYLFLNTKDYGLPQNRERLFIIGIIKNKMKKKFEGPKKIILKKSPKEFIDTSDTHKDDVPNFCSETLKLQKGTFVDLSFLKYTNPESYQKYSPTITTNCNMWNVPMHRKANIKELLKLQGFPVSFKFPTSVSKARIIKQIGNSMSVNVLEHIFLECFKTIGIL